VMISGFRFSWFRDSLTKGVQMKRFLMASMFAGLCLFGQVDAVLAQVYNPYVRAYTPAPVANPYVGVEAVRNPYTGTTATTAVAHNPYTGTTAQESARYNPYTGTAARSQSAVNPYTG